MSIEQYALINKVLRKIFELLNTLNALYYKHFKINRSAAFMICFLFFYLYYIYTFLYYATASYYVRIEYELLPVV